MNNLYRLSVGLLFLGILGASACSGCSPAPAADSKSAPVLQQHSYTCGANTHKVGNQCVADSAGTQSTTPRPLSTSGNN